MIGNSKTAKSEETDENNTLDYISRHATAILQRMDAQDNKLEALHREITSYN